MRIGDVAKQAGIPASTLRYYERIGLIEPPDRSSGQQDYNDDIFDMLQIIQAAKSAGFSLTDIRQLIESAHQFIKFIIVQCLLSVRKGFLRRFVNFYE